MADVHLCPECGAELPEGAAEAPCAACLMKLGMRSWAASRDGDREDSPPARTRLHHFAAPAPAELAARFPQLEILELRGQGGMGAVYKARQKSLDRLVALKIINPDAADDPGFASRFEREAKALARLNHPNIVGVHDFGQTDGLFYLIMEYVDGVDVRSLISDGKLQPAEALMLVPQICDALQYAHEEGIVHRDIKPENILVDKRGRVKIADFGLAKLLRLSAVEMTLTHTRQVVGTFHYMAPEQFERPGEVDHRADIYALGVVFYEMLTGTLPVGRFDLPSQRCAVDARLDDVVLRALEREPDRRYQHASEVKTDVESLDAFPHKPVKRQAAPQPVAGDPETELEEVREQLAMPAIGLIVYGTLGLLTAVITFLIVGFRQIMGFENLNDELWILFGCCLGGGILAVVVMMTGVVMRSLESYDFVVAGAIVSLLTFFTPITWIFAIPLGIWSLHLLRQPRVRKAFAFQRRVWREDPQLSARRAVQKKLASVAWGLIVTGAMAVLFPVAFLCLMNPGDREHLLPVLIGSLPGVLIIAGGVSILRLGPYEAAMAGAVAALIPCGPIWLISLPVGLAAVFLLRKSGVGAEFTRWAASEDADLKSGPGDYNKVTDGSAEEPLEPKLEEAHELLTMPAIAMMVYGSLGLVAAVGNLAVVSIVDVFIEPIQRDVLATWVVACLAGGPVAAIVLAAGTKMRNLDNYDFVVAGALVTLLSAAGMFTAIVAAPLGIWSLALLRKPGVRQAFARRKVLRQEDPRVVAGKKIGGVAWLLIGAGMVSVLGPMLVYLMIDRYARSAFAPALVSIPAGLAMLLGGCAMLRRGPYEAAMAGAVAALLPCGPAWLLSLPAGLVALIVLRRSHAAIAFSRLVERDPSPPEVEKGPWDDSRLDLTYESGPWGSLWQDDQKLVHAPAIGLIVAGSISLFATAVAAVIAGFWLMQRHVTDFELPRLLTIFGAGMGLSILAAAMQILGGIQMKRRESRWLAIVGALAALVPLSFAWPFGLATGLWALYVLHRPEVKEAFLRRERRWDHLERSLRIASRLLTVTAALQFAFIPLAWVHHVFTPYLGLPWMTQTFVLGIASTLLMLVCTILFAGAARMRRGDSWSWALAASILALFPLTPAVVLALPAGIYGLSLLTRPGVREWFATPAKPVDEPAEFHAAV